MTDTLREAVEQLRVEYLRLQQVGLTCVGHVHVSMVSCGDVATRLLLALAAHPASAPEPGRCTCGLPGCSDEPDTAGDEQPTPGALERITLCRRSPVRDRWECITWPDKPTAYPCVHDHSHCDYIGCVEHVDGMHVDKAGDAIVHVSCDRCVDPPTDPAGSDTADEQCDGTCASPEDLRNKPHVHAVTDTADERTFTRESEAARCGCGNPDAHDYAPSSIPAGSDTADGPMCTHPLGFLLDRDGDRLRCPDCKAECPGSCVCGAPFRSMACANRAHLRGPDLVEPGPSPAPEDEREAHCCLVYSCDSDGCRNEFVANSCDEILAIVRLVEAGWSVHAADQGPIPGYRRLHYCPTHTWTWPVPDLAPEDGREALARIIWSGRFYSDCGNSTARNIIAAGWRSPTEVAALVADAERRTREQVAGEIRRHAEHMEGYTLPAISPGFLDGYRHALRLLRRDADFIAARAATKAVSDD